MDDVPGHLPVCFARCGTSLAKQTCLRLSAGAWNSCFIGLCAPRRRRCARAGCRGWRAPFV